MKLSNKVKLRKRVLFHDLLVYLTERNGHIRMHILQRKCPVCGCEEGEMIRTVPVSPLLCEDSRLCSYDIVSCADCGMVFADSALTAEQLDAYYTSCNMYDTASYNKVEEYKANQELYFSQILPYLNKDTKLADIGCANGYFLRFLREKGYSNLWGIDPSESSIRKLREAQINGVVGSAYDRGILEGKKGTFDIVTVCGVLEHLLFPELAVQNIKRLLKSDGILYILVPNAEGFERYPWELPNYFNREHINYFTPKTLDFLLCRAGLHRCSPDVDCRTIVMPAEVPLPEMAISAAYRLRPADETGRISVCSYFDQFENRWANVKRAVLESLDSGKPILIWGTGALSAFLLSNMPELLERVVGFLDNDKSRHGTNYYGKQIFRPEEISRWKDAAIIVCVMTSRNSVLHQIDEMRIKNQIILLSQTEGLEEDLTC